MPSCSCLRARPDYHRPLLLTDGRACGDARPARPRPMSRSEAEREQEKRCRTNPILPLRRW